MSFEELKNKSKMYNGSRIGYFTINKSHSSLNIFIFLGIYYLLYFFVWKSKGEYHWIQLGSGTAILLAVLLGVKADFKKVDKQKRRIIKLIDYVNGKEDELAEITHKIQGDEVVYLLSYENIVEGTFNFNIYKNKIYIHDKSISNGTKEHKFLAEEAGSIIERFHEQNFDNIVRPIIEERYNKEKTMFDLYK